MTIPEKLKIGAKVYGVEITNKLDLGNVNYSGEIVSHILDGTLLSWLASWKMKSQMLVAFLLENEKARLSEKD